MSIEKFKEWAEPIKTAVAWTDTRMKMAARASEINQKVHTERDWWSEQIKLFNVERDTKPELKEILSSQRGLALFQLLTLHEQVTLVNIDRWESWWKSIDVLEVPRVVTYASWFMTIHRELWAVNLIICPTTYPIEQIALKVNSMVNLLNDLKMEGMPWYTNYINTKNGLPKTTDVKKLRARMTGILPLCKMPLRADTRSDAPKLKPFRINFTAEQLHDLDKAAIPAAVETNGLRPVPKGFDHKEYYESFFCEEVPMDSFMKTFGIENQDPIVTLEPKTSSVNKTVNISSDDTMEVEIPKQTDKQKRKRAKTVNEEDRKAEEILQQIRLEAISKSRPVAL